MRWTLPLLLAACAASSKPNGGAAGSGPAPSGGDTAGDTGEPDDGDDTASVWPETEVDWSPGVTLVYEGAVLSDGAAVSIETAPAGIDEASVLRFTLTNRSGEALTLPADPSLWLSGEGFTTSGPLPEHLEPEESAPFEIAVNPVDATAAEARAGTLSVPAEPPLAVSLLASVPRPLRLVVAGDGPTVLLSEDYGATWSATVEPTEIQDAVHSVTWGEGRFFLASQEGFSWSVAGHYQWSEDGTTWTASAASDDFWVSDCAYGMGQFFCVRSDTISWSDSGETVLHESTQWDDMLLSVLYTGERFVATGRNGRRVTSTDGSSWATEDNFADGDYLSDLARSDDGTLVAVGGWGGERYTVSRSVDDGLTWTDQSWCDSQYTRMESVAWGDGLWLAGGVSNSCDGVWASTDGLTWTAVHDDSVQLLGFVNGWFIGALHPWSELDELVRSRDGADWETVYTAVHTEMTIRAMALEGR